MRRWFLPALLALASCTDSGPNGADKPPRLSLEELKNPETCSGCHPKHYREWAGSMHAYASLDPVFRAMNQRGQRETNGALGKFCVQCHAPMALRDNLTTDGMNLDDLPSSAQGVTCYFCHNATGTGDDHFNANVSLANDDVMRGTIANAVDPGAHGVAYSVSHDRNKMEASTLCGTCHDVVNPKGLHIERTLKEYEASLLSIAKSGQSGGLSCQSCHMPWQETGTIAEVAGLKLPQRDRHEHRWPAVDTALTDFPHREEHEHATQCAIGVGGTRFIDVVHLGAGLFEVQIETEAGHLQPSGTAQDRRFWLEFTAYDADGSVLLESGKIEDGALEEYPQDDPQGRYDPNLCLFRDYLLNEANEDVHMFWEAASVDRERSRSLPFLVDPESKHIATCRYQIPGFQAPDRIEARMRMRPVGMDVLSSLVDSGDLDRTIPDQMKTWTLHGTVAEWRKDTATWSAIPATDITCP